MAMSPALRLSLWLLALAAPAPGVATAQVYKWVDERGVTHYGQKPPTMPPRAGIDSLDIELTGNDPPKRSGDCYSIQCQYERLRADRLERQEEQLKEWEARQRAATARKQADAAAAAAAAQSDDRWSRRSPIYGRPILRPAVPRVPAPTQPAASATPAEPGASLRISGE
ncbi:MAG: DUF4124 domain-containing protein [Betaproteobacteria bacterium]|jgi:hypothetical protein